LIKFIETIKPNQKYTKELHLIRKEYYKNIQNEKHEDINIDDELIKNNNNIIKEIFDNKKKEEEKINKLIKKELLSAHLSEMKMGPLNPNYGVERPKEHSDKISKSTFGKKRQITDETIVKIYSLKNSGKTKQEIAKEFNISRGTVGDIFDGKKVISTEYENHLNYKEEKKNKNEEF
jgi:hypothetical protein